MQNLLLEILESTVEEKNRTFSNFYLTLMMKPANINVIVSKIKFNFTKCSIA